MKMTDKGFLAFLKKSAGAFPAEGSSPEFCDFVEEFGTLYVEALGWQGNDPLADIELIFKTVVPLHQSFDQSKAKKIIDDGWEPDSAQPSNRRKASFADLCRCSALGANFVCPGWSVDAWERFFCYWLQRKYGGRRVWIKKRRSEAAKAAAKTMTPKQLMKKFGICRSYAYCLVRTKKGGATRINIPVLPLKMGLAFHHASVSNNAPSGARKDGGVWRKKRKTSLRSSG